MLTLARTSRMFVATSPTDLRRSYDGLAAIVEGQFARQVRAGDVFVFVNRRGTQIRMSLREPGAVVGIYLFMRANLIHRICTGIGALTLFAGAGCDASEPDSSDALRVDLSRFGIDAVVPEAGDRYTLVDDEGIEAGHVQLDRTGGGLAAEVELEDGEITRIAWSSEDAWLQCGEGARVDQGSDLALVDGALDACGDEFDIAMLVAAAVGEDASSSPDAEAADEEFRQCNWSAVGRQMDRYTAMCAGWGYDQGIFTFNGCSVRLDYCIHW